MSDTRYMVPQHKLNINFLDYTQFDGMQCVCIAAWVHLRILSIG